jgi:hypothetical protein
MMGMISIPLIIWVACEEDSLKPQETISISRWRDLGLMPPDK